jgi:hypothetical protein
LARWNDWQRVLSEDRLSRIAANKQRGQRQ